MNRSAPPTSHGKGLQANDVEMELSSVALENARSDLLGTIDACQQFLVALELTRMRKARVGRPSWLGAMRRYYEQANFNMLCDIVAHEVPLINLVFEHTFWKLCWFIRQARSLVQVADSVQTIWLWREWLYCLLIGSCEERRRDALCLFDCLRANLDYALLVLSENSEEEMKRYVFGLTGDGNYYLGGDTPPSLVEPADFITLEHTATGSYQVQPCEPAPIPWRRQVLISFLTRRFQDGAESDHL